MNVSNLLNLIGCHGNQNIKIAKTYSKIFSEAVRGMKLKLSINVHYDKISLYKNNYVFVGIVRVRLSLWQLKVSIDL